MFHKKGKVVIAEKTVISTIGCIDCKRIVNNLAYDTEKSDVVANYFQSGRKTLFLTKNGRYFSCDREVNCDTYYTSQKNVEGDDEYVKVHKTINKYDNLVPISTEEAKLIIGEYAPDKYTELFGEVEEA